MKKIIVFSLLLIISATSFSQQTTTPLVKTDYLKKSKKQKTIAGILAGTGVGLVMAALVTTSANDAANFIIGEEASGFNTGTTLFAIGGIMTLSSIPLFIIAGSNKRKGMSLSFKNETSPQIQKSSFVYKYVPSLTLKISL